MAQKLNTHAEEEGTYVITATFKDEDGNAEDVKTAKWSLTDRDGTVINSRSDVAISTPTSSEDIVLSGNDLALQSGETNLGIRILIVEATYDSDLGSDLPLKGEAEFIIDNLVKVT